MIMRVIGEANIQISVTTSVENNFYSQNIISSIFIVVVTEEAEGGGSIP